jgi:hypothetical protein
VETLIVAALAKADPDAVYTLMLSPNLDLEARDALEADSHGTVSYEDASGRGGISAGRVLLVESVLLPPASESASVSEFDSPPVGADIGLWLGDKPRLRLPGPPPAAFPPLNLGSQR